MKYKLVAITHKWIKTKKKGSNEICKGWTILKNVFLKFSHSTFVTLRNLAILNHPSHILAYYDVLFSNIKFSNYHVTLTQPIRARVRFN